MHTTRSCRGKSPSWKSATCERLQNETSFPNHSSSESSASVSCRSFSSHHILPATHSASLLSRSVPFISSHVLLLSSSPSFSVDRRSLMEQLRRLQALIMNTSNKPAQTGTCVLVCSFPRPPTNKQTTAESLEKNNHSTTWSSCWACQCLEKKGQTVHHEPRCNETPAE